MFGIKHFFMSGLSPIDMGLQFRLRNSHVMMECDFDTWCSLKVWNLKPKTFRFWHFFTPSEKMWDIRHPTFAPGSKRTRFMIAKGDVNGLLAHTAPYGAQFTIVGG